MCNYCALLTPGDFRTNKVASEGTAAVVSYRFVKRGDFNDEPNPYNGRLVEANADLKSAVQRVANHLEDITGIKLVKVDDDADAMIDIYRANISSGVSYAYYPNIRSDEDGGTFNPGNSYSNLVMNTRYTSYEKGSAGFQVLLHEFGHSLGLKHPFDDEPNLPSRLDNTNNTVMSYTWRGPNKFEYQRFDKQALRELYGDGDGVDGLTVRWSSGRDVMTIIGTRKDDQFLGVNDSNWIDGGFGDDVIFGRDSRDTLRGGGGDDTMRAQNGDDIMRGAGGDDLQNGQQGDDKVLGANGNDTLRGGDGDDILYGGEGNDRLFGEFGNDNLLGNGGSDLIDGGWGRDRIVGHQGADTLKGGGEGDMFVLTPGGGADRIVDFNKFEGDQINVRQLGFSRAEALSRLEKVGNNMELSIGFQSVVLVGEGNTNFDGSEFIV